MSKTSEKNWRWIFIVLAMLGTLLSVYFRVFYGWDQDQSYMIMMAKLIASGKVLFRDLWDLHQTGAIIPALLIRLFQYDSYEGIAVFLRICSVCVQIVVAILSFTVLRKYYKLEAAFVGAVLVANFLPRASQQLEYSTVSIWSAIICSLLLLDANKGKQHIQFKTCISGLFYALSVFSYPTMIISVPFYVWQLGFILDKPKERWKNMFCFFGVCFVCVMILFVYLLNFMSFSELLDILRELGKNGDHTGFFSFLSNPDILLKSITRIVAILIAGYLLKLIIQKSASLSLPTVIPVMVLSTAIVLFLNIAGIRKSGPFGLLERYVAVMISGLYFVHENNKNRLIIHLFFYGGIVYYLGSLMGSNLGVNENAMYLELSVLGLTLLLLLFCGNCTNQLQSKIIRCSLFFYIFGIVFFSGYFVRIDGTGPANILDCTERLEDGPLEQIHVLPEQSASYGLKKKEVPDLTDHKSPVMIINRNVIYNFYVAGECTATSYAATAVHNEQWVDYYSKFNHTLPEIILISKDWYTDFEAFSDTEFGAFIRGKGYRMIGDSSEFFVVS